MTSDRTPEYLTISPTEIDPALVRRAADALRAGGLVAFPTETVYGLGCDAFNEAAVQRVFDAKGRPLSDPLIVHVDGMAMLERVVAGPLPDIAVALIDRFWPGPLTLVLPRCADLPEIVSSGLPSVAVRFPAHPVASAIVTACGTPVAAPSANRFSHVSPTSAQHVLADLGDSCDVIVDSGRTERGLESTVVVIADDEAVVLRHGAIPLEVLGDHGALRVSEASNASPVKASPGHEKRHYSPRAPTVAIASGILRSASPETLAALARRGVVLAGYADRPCPLPEGWRFEPLGSALALDEVAHDLYAALRRMDASGADVIVLELTGAPGLGRAIDDRITRAASSLVVEDPGDLASAIDAARSP